MRAAVLREAPGKLVVEDLAIDDPGPQEVRIRTVAAGVCQTELHVMRGKNPAALPAVLGHESAGIVEAVGEDVKYVEPGNHVVTCVSRFCGECFQCLTGHPALCPQVSTGRAADAPSALRSGTEPVNTFVGLGSFAEEMLVNERSVVRIDCDIPLDKASLAGCAVLTGYGAVVNTAQVKPGSTVVVIGCGGIGLNCLQSARLAGALQIIAIDVVDSKLKLAQEFGATHAINSRQCDPVEAILELTKGGADYSFEAIGSPQTIRQAISCLRRGGVATAIGMVPPDSELSLTGADLMAERKLQGCRMGSNRFRLDIPTILAFYQQGRLKLDELVSHRVPLNEINEAYEQLATGEVARNIITF